MYRLSTPFVRVYKYAYRHPIALVFTISFAVYVITASRDITFTHFGSDGGELIAASYTLGVPHPPGYPIYVVIGKLFSYLPIGTVAFRYSLLSSLAMAVTAALVARGVLMLGGRKTPVLTEVNLTALSSALLFAFTPLVWSQAIIAEVYALNLLILAIMMNLLLGENSVRHTFLTGLFLGLGVTMHLSYALMAPAAFLLTDRTVRKKLILGAGIGLVPLLLLPALAMGNSPIVWGRPDQPLGWLNHITGRLYHQNVLAELPSGSKWYTYGYYAGPFAIVILLAAYFSGRHLSWKMDKRTAGIIASAALFTLFSLSYATDDSVVYLLPAMFLIALIIAHPLTTLRFWGLMLPLGLVGLNFAGINLRNDNFIRGNAFTLLPKIPAGAIVLTPGDPTISALWYFQSVEQLREDVLFVDEVLFQFPWYRSRLGSMHSNLLGLSQDDLGAFVDRNASESRQICRMSLVAPVYIDCNSNKS